MLKIEILKETKIKNNLKIRKDDVISWIYVSESERKLILQAVKKYNSPFTVKIDGLYVGQKGNTTEGYFFVFNAVEEKNRFIKYEKNEVITRSRGGYINDLNIIKIFKLKKETKIKKEMPDILTIDIARNAMAQILTYNKIHIGELEGLIKCKITDTNKIQQLFSELVGEAANKIKFENNYFTLIK
jgi:hypothetical protein